MLWDHPQHQPASPKRNLQLVSTSVNGRRIPYFSYTLCDRCNTFAFGLGSAIRWILQLGSKSVNVSAVLYFSYTLCDRCNEFAFGLGSAIRISRFPGHSTAAFKKCECLTFLYSFYFLCFFFIPSILLHRNSLISRFTHFRISRNS